MFIVDYNVTMIENSLDDRFWSKVDKTRTCWIWVGALDNNGYGKYRLGTKTFAAHRLAYIDANTHIDDRKVLDHLCRVRPCVNPAHLEPVTIGENVVRGVIARRRNMCVKGIHPMSGLNVYMNPTTGKPRCKACRNEYRRRYWLEKHDNRP